MIHGKSSTTRYTDTKEAGRGVAMLERWRDELDNTDKRNCKAGEAREGKRDKRDGGMKDDDVERQGHETPGEVAKAGQMVMRE